MPIMDPYEAKNATKYLLISDKFHHRSNRKWCEG